MLGVEAEAHLDHFAHSTHDDVWLADIGHRGWIVITNDKRIRFNESERRALTEHSVGCFVLTSGNRTKWETMRALAKGWDRIQQIAATVHRPFIYSLHVDGTVAPLHPRPTTKGRNRGITRRRTRP